MTETIGQQLKAAREARNLTFEKVTQVTHIQARLLKALEEDDFESLPSPVQARAFLRSYAGFLELSLDDLIARQRMSSGQPEVDSPTAVPAPELPPEILEKLDLPGPTASTPETSIEQPAIHPEEPEKNEKHGRFAVLFGRLRQRFPKAKPASDSAGSDLDSAKEPEPIPEIVPEPEAESEPEPESEPVTGADNEAGSIPEVPAPKQVPVEFDDAVVNVQVPREEPPAGQEPGQRQSSRQIFVAIGAGLRRQREMLSLTLDEVESHLHVRVHYLQAMEAGDIDHLPSSVQARGMLNNYARFLDMDVDVLLLQFADGLQAQRLERQAQDEGPIEHTGSKASSRRVLPAALRRYLSMDSIVGVGLVLILLVFAIWGTSRIMGIRSATTPFPTAQSISDVLENSTAGGTLAPTDSPEPSQAALPGDAIATGIGTLPSAGSGPVQVVVVALGQAFLRVTVDGVQQFNGRITAGTAYPYAGNDQIEVLTGDGSAISIIFNQSDLGPLGSLGQVVDRIYTANAILEPTATTTPTPTITPTPTLTPRFSPTPTQTPTSTITLPGQ